jgi:hypothetical protein
VVTVNARYALSRPSRMWLKSENPASDAARRLLSGAEYADAASVMAAADTTGRTTRQNLSGLIHSSSY